MDKTFKTRSIITPRTVQISEAFGIGVDEEKTFPVFHQFLLDLNPGQGTYITGDSGSGKSVLLRELVEAIQRSGEFGGVAPMVEPDADEVLVEGVGRDTDEAVRILSWAGLNEAFLMLRRYRELSDGQKYRYRIAKAIDSGKGTWAFDEFGSVLDRVTAKVVAYCVQKAARRLGRTLIVATTHEDLGEDLNPDVVVRKRFGPLCRLEYIRDRIDRPFSLLSEVKIHEGTRKDFADLEDFHYRGGLPQGLVKKIYVAELHGEVVGGVVYTMPHFSLRGRHFTLPEYKIYPIRKRVQLLNRDFLRISRVVVLPKFRSVGLGVKLVRDTCPLVGVPYVETLAVMAKYNPFFERAGFLRVYDPFQEESPLVKLLGRLEAFGLNISLVRSRQVNVEFIHTLGESGFRRLLQITWSGTAAGHLSRNQALLKEAAGGSREALAEALTKIPLPSLYLVWKNPDPRFKGYPTPKGGVSTSVKVPGERT